MVFCRGCGKEIHESAPSCPHCGAPQGGAQSNVQDKAIPDGVKGWSWGAFFLTWIWAIGNRTWIGLLALVPYVNLIMMIILGIKGREWAWKNKQWDSLEHFNRVQRKWSAWGVGIMAASFAVALVGVLAAIALPAYQDYQKRATRAELAQREETTRIARAEESAAREQAAREQAAREQEARVVASLDPPRSMESSTSGNAQQSVPDKAIVASAASGEISLLDQASKCADVDSCVGFMLKAADPRRQEVIQMAAARISDFPKPEKGDRKRARELNKQGLDVLATGDYSASASLFQQAALQDPKDVEIQSNLGMVLVRAGKANDAERVLKNALLLDPKRTSAWNPLAEAYDQQGKKQNAIAALLVAFEYSGNKEKTLAYYSDKSTSADRESLRNAYGTALSKLNSQ